VGMNHITELLVPRSMGAFACVGMNHITELLVQWSTGVFVVSV
jgi:hypothetical protein